MENAEFVRINAPHLLSLPPVLWGWRQGICMAGSCLRWPWGCWVEPQPWSSPPAPAARCARSCLLHPQVAAEAPEAAPGWPSPRHYPGRSMPCVLVWGKSLVISGCCCCSQTFPRHIPHSQPARCRRERNLVKLCHPAPRLVAGAAETGGGLQKPALSPATE